MIVADASFLIALAEPGDDHHSTAARVRREVEGQVLLLHPLTLAECLVGPARTGRLEQAEAAWHTATVVVDFDPASPARFALRRAETGLRLPDVVVLDTAIVHRAGIATFDDRLAITARAEGITVLAG